MFSIRRFAPALACLALIWGCAMAAAATDLRSLERPAAPNNALACLPSLCLAESDLLSPRFDIPAEQLMGIVRQAVSGQPRTELVAEDAALRQLVFAQRSKVFGFRDTIQFQIVPVDSGSTVIAYSRSDVGGWDLGVNRRRLQHWLRAIRHAATTVTP